jgi:hypothetical protein
MGGAKVIDDTIWAKLTVVLSGDFCANHTDDDEIEPHVARMTVLLSCGPHTRSLNLTPFGKNVAVSGLVNRPQGWEPPLKVFVMQPHRGPVIAKSKQDSRGEALQIYLHHATVPKSPTHTEQG